MILGPIPLVWLILSSNHTATETSCLGDRQANDLVTVSMTDLMCELRTSSVYGLTASKWLDGITFCIITNGVYFRSDSGVGHPLFVPYEFDPDQFISYLSLSTSAMFGN
ncbi:MAG: hypothetical protein WCD18_19195 [Thermosynechococcaceae cyanobacterium]